jgi:PAS domain S-box-containing protein
MRRIRALCLATLLTSEFSLDVPSAQMDAALSETEPLRASAPGMAPTQLAPLEVGDSIERWRLAEQAGHIGTWEWDPETDITFWSEGAERLHALAPGTFSGTHDAATQNVHPDDLAAVRDSVADLLRDGTNELEYRIILPDGSVRWIWAFGKVGEGEHPRVTGIHMDITARKAAEASIAASENRFRDWANAAPVLIWVSGVDGQCTFFNEQWLRFTGRTLDQEAGMGWSEGVHPADRDSCLSTYATAFSAREPFELEYRLRNHAGEYCWVLDRGTPILHADGSFDGYIGSCIDISERKRANESLQLLADIGVQLAASLDRDATLEAVASAVVPSFADWCSVTLLGEGGELTRAATAHRDPISQKFLDRLEPYAAATIDGDQTVARVIRKGRPLLVPAFTDEMLQAHAHDEQHLALLRKLNVGSGISVPMFAHGRTIGAISFTSQRGGRVYGPGDLHLAEDIARRAALAVDNARLYAEARQHEVSLRRANDSLQFLADASTELSKSLDPEETLANVATLAVPGFADICFVDIVQPLAPLARVGLAVQDDALRHAAERLADVGRNGRQDGDAVGDTISAQRSIFFPVIQTTDLVAFARSPEHLAVLQELGPTSAMLVPLTARGRVMGVITFLRTGASEHYTPDDLAVAEQLGRRAGLSVDNARLYQEGQEREAELVRANEAKDEFLGLMSHELRTPITVVHGGARVLRSRGESLDEATRTSMLADIERESDRLARMLENLLALARVELDQEPVVEPVLVQRLLDRLVANYEQSPSHRAIELNAPGNIASVAAEPAYLEHVIRNLISNAEKYSPAGSTIEIQLEQLDQESVAIRVLDHGFGIGQEEAERIFERFYRSDRTAKLAGGAGMGLAVCKRLIEAMSGQIWARPRQGGGLEVGFSLPFYEETES